MSLNPKQKLATKNELIAALRRSDLSLEELAQELGTNLSCVKLAFELEGAIENPWILKEFLAEKALDKGREPINFTALKGDYHDYLFLDSQVIENRILR